MKKELKSLHLKIDQLAETQKLILELLNQSTILTKEPPINLKKTSKKVEKNKRMEELRLVLINSPVLKRKFNLAVSPQGNRILAYLRTNDPKVFDGLKRNG